MENLKKLVQEKYGQIAKDSSEPEKKSGCGCGCDDSTYTIFSENYAGKEGYAPDADLVLDAAFPRILFT